MTLQDLENQTPSVLACFAFTERAYALSAPLDLGDLLRRPVTHLSVPFYVQDDKAMIEMYSVNGTDAKLLIGPPDFLKDEVRWLCLNDGELIHLIRAEIDNHWHFNDYPELKKQAEASLALFAYQLRGSLPLTQTVESVDL